MYPLQVNINWMPLISIILPILGALIGIWYKGYITKPESNADIAKKRAEESLVLEQAKKVAEERTKLMIDEYRELVQTMVAKMQDAKIEREAIRQEMQAMREENRDLKNENIECELRADAAQLEMMVIRKELNMTAWRKETVFVLDDSKVVLVDFDQRFKKITALDYKGFTDYEEFIRVANVEQPGIVVMDWHVGEGVTAEHVKARLGYKPEMFIMSHDKKVQAVLSEMRIRFFYKGAHYVQQILKAIFEHLKDKN